MRDETGWSPAEIDAARRYVKGEKLTRVAQRTLEKLKRRLASEHRYNRRPDVQRQEEQMFANIDQALREDWARKQGLSFPATAASPLAPATSPAHHGATPLAPRSTAARASGPGGGGGALPGRTSSLDANRLTDLEYRQLLTARGYDASFFESRNSPRPPLPSAPLALKMNAIQRRAAEATAARAQQLKQGAIDGRTATPEQVQARIETLLGPHRERPLLDGAFRPAGEPLKPPDLGPDPLAASLEATRRAERRAREAIRSGKPVDARRMPDDVFARYLELRGFASPSSWGPAGRAPKR